MSLPKRRVTHQRQHPLNVLRRVMPRMPEHSLVLTYTDLSFFVRFLDQVSRFHFSLVRKKCRLARIPGNPVPSRGVYLPPWIPQ